MQKKNIIRIAFVTAGILLIPLVAMQFTDEVNWNLDDFVVMGVLLFGAGIAYELTMKRIGTTTYRVVAGISITIVFLLIWMEFAVGIFGTPWAGS